MANNITIDFEEYDCLNRESIRLEVLKAVLYNTAHLGYDGELRFDEDKVSAVLQALDPAGYATKQRLLKLDKEKSE